MFESLSDKLTAVFNRLGGKGKLSEKDVDEALREVRMALLEERTEQNRIDLEACKDRIDKTDQGVEDVRLVQNQSLVVLQKMETSLEHLNDKMEIGEKAREATAATLNNLSQEFIRTDSKFKLVLLILGAIGVTMLGVAVKILFYSPNLAGG